MLQSCFASREQVRFLWRNRSKVSDMVSAMLGAVLLFSAISDARLTFVVDDSLRQVSLRISC
jgi:hypothetical protein